MQMRILDVVFRRPAPVVAGLALFLASGFATDAASQGARPTVSTDDPRVGLSAGVTDAGQAAHNMELLVNRPRPEGFVTSNTDIAFQGNLAFVGSYDGFNVYDITDPANPTLRSSFICPGGQGDLSVYGNLLFMSVEETRGRVDCGTEGVRTAISPDRFRGLRIFDVANLDQPRQVATIQTCRGSHTHTLVPDARDPSQIYVYISGTGGVRQAAELEGCVGDPDDPNTALFRIEVVRVPLAAPHQAEVVSMPRIFADRETGAIGGLWPGGDHGPSTQSSSPSNRCHDITVYPAFGLAAGACAGNGILLDISDPANPVRIHEVADPNFAFWHSATFNNDASKIIFTDEWGGGSAPRCRATDRPEWGANAIFTLADRQMELASYYKLPAAQTELENCVAHNGSLVPVPGRDIKVQAWYQGGVSVFDFTDAANPVEIAFFDRGPMSGTELMTGGYWSTYWYNGYVYGSEMGRGFDVLRLTPSEHLSQNEIDAANLVRFDEFNPQMQPHMSWPAAFVVARAYADQLGRNGGLPAARLRQVASALDRAEGLTGQPRGTALTQLATELDRDATRSSDAARVQALAGVVRQLAAQN
jgi:hypothetical protein